MFEKNEQALDLTEQAIVAFNYSDNETADKRLDQAKSLGPSAVGEVGADPEDEDEEELDEDDDDEDDDEDEEEDDVPGIDEEGDQDPTEEDEEE